jgi:hypothetical protein
VDTLGQTIAAELERIKRERHRARVSAARHRREREIWKTRALRAHASLRNVEAERDWLKLQVRTMERESAAV